MSLLKPTRHQNKAIRDSCRGKPCQLMLAPQCSSNETTQPAHVQLRGHGGTGTKPSDLFLVDGCDNCHATLDGRVKSEHSRDYPDFDFSEIIQAAEAEAESNLGDDKQESPNYFNKDASPYARRFF